MGRLVRVSFGRNDAVSWLARSGHHEHWPFLGDCDGHMSRGYASRCAKA
jgi:hypothetical protein